MQLTQKQESMISRYLRDLAAKLDDSIPERNRERSLRQVQARIYKDLEALPGNVVGDGDVIAVLQRALSPAEMAPAAAPAAAVRPVLPKAGAPVWLGVCAFNADRFEVSPQLVRIAAVLLGLATGPLAVFAYLAAYVEYYLAQDRRERAPIDVRLLALRVIGPLAAAIVLRWGTYKLFDLIALGFEKIFGESPPPLGRWDWLAAYDGTMFFLLCASIIPISILSGLPLANAWGHSLKRLAQALVALYAMALCFGTASILVGLILDRVQPYMQ